MKLHIKFMVSHRCKMVVKDTLNNIGLHYRTVELGEVDLIENKISFLQYDMLKDMLMKAGLELMNDKKAVLIEKIKNVVVEMVHYADELPITKISIYISEKLRHDYTYLSNIFSAATGITIEHYIISHKIEKAKELILYDELNLTEISYKLHYSSVAHLSTQFKKITGLTPTYFKKIHAYKKRIMLETV
ncbi:MAG: AraC family transcriptional regulator [Ferruginibacter sp.]